MFLLGQFPSKLHNRRLYLPAPLLRQLKESEFVINRGFERYLSLQPMDEFQRSVSSLYKLARKDEDALRYLRYYTRGAHQLTIRDHYTTTVSKALLDYANIGKDAVIIGMLKNIEIFNPESFEIMLDDPTAAFQELAKRVVPSIELIQPPPILIQENLIIPEQSKIITDYVNNFGFTGILKDPGKIMNFPAGF